MDLNALREFCAVISEGSFAAAARRLDMPKSTVSKRIQDLEASLGAKLIERTTRRLRLTSEGASVLARAQRILADASEIEAVLGAAGEAPRGHLRLAVETTFGQSFIGTISAASRRLHPLITLEIVLTDSHPDLIEEGFDGAIRGGPLPDGASGKVFATGRRVVVGAPEIFGPVADPDQLTDLPALLRGVGLIETWHLTDGSRERSVRVAGGLAMNSDIALRHAALGGAGIALLPEALVASDLERGSLVRLLDRWTDLPQRFHFGYPGASALTARLGAFLAVLSAAFPDGTLHGGICPETVSELSG
jgi:DNA-binding transcriptional LysR family regulator